MLKIIFNYIFLPLTISCSCLFLIFSKFIYIIPLIFLPFTIFCLYLILYKYIYIIPLILTYIFLPLTISCLSIIIYKNIYIIPLILTYCSESRNSQNKLNSHIISILINIIAPYCFFYINIKEGIRRKAEYVTDSHSFNKIPKFKKKEEVPETAWGYKFLGSSPFLLPASPAALIPLLTNLLSKFTPNKIYSVYWSINWGPEEKKKGYAISKSIKIYSSVNVEILAHRLAADIRKIQNMYNLPDQSVTLTSFFKIWDETIPAPMEDIKSVLSHLIAFSLDIEITNVKSRIEGLHAFPYLNLNDYGNLIKTIDLEDGVYSVFKLNSTTYILTKEINKISKKVFVFEKHTGDYFDLRSNSHSWTDVIDPLTNLSRRILEHTIYFYQDGILKFVEFNYGCKKSKFVSIFKRHRKPKVNTKIGVLDFEAYLDANQIFNVYAGGYSINGVTKTVYAHQGKDSKYIINKIVEGLFNYPKTTFYCHNFGRFDAILMLKSLIETKKYELKGIWRNNENSLLSLKIIDIESKKYIKINDSYPILKNSLKDLLLSFGCTIEKGIFPYSFVNGDRLNYIGDKPDLSYFPGASIEEYNKIPSKGWSTKKETIKYLEKDLKGLLELVNKFSDSLMKDYNLRMTDQLTIGSLGVNIFLSKYTNQENIEKLVTLPSAIEKDIRSAFYGGISRVNKHIVGPAFVYDKNSQFPYAMLNPMPVGTPIFSTDPELKNYFGFVFAEITPPNPNLIIAYRDQYGYISYPTNPFQRWIASEELKASVQYGYQYKLICGLKFEKAEALFNDYILNIYPKKANGVTPEEKSKAKLLLNTIFGKMGANSPFEEIRFVKKYLIPRLERYKHIEFIADLGDTCLIKDWGFLPDQLINLLRVESLDKDILSHSTEGLYPGAEGFIPVAAMTAAFARMTMYPYIYNEKNPPFVINTDSIVVPFPLDNNLIGKEIGQMKLEHSIKEGIFISPKLYGLLTESGETIIKSAGIKKGTISYGDLIKLASGEQISILNKNFSLDFTSMTISEEEKYITLQPLYSN